MLAGYDKSLITRFSIVSSDTEQDLLMHGYPTYLFQGSFSALPIKSTLTYWKFKTSELQRCVSNIKNVLSKRKVDLIWIILNGVPTIQLAAELTQVIDIPFVAHIWDAPEYKAEQMRLDPFSRNHLLRKFDQVMNHAKLSVTISESMGRIYKEKYNLPYKSMVFCPPKSSLRSFNLRSEPKRNKINVVFAGSLYAHKEWTAFLNAIEENNSDKSNIEISVLCIGPVSRWAKKRSFVTYEELKPIDEASGVINKCDVAYLPYWMDEKYSYAVRTAFPSKMSLYVASATPVFYHGPKFSTPTEFLNSYKVGLSCHTLDSMNILNILFELVGVKFQEQYSASQKQTLEQIFNPNRCTEIFAESIQLTLRA